MKRLKFSKLIAAITAVLCLPAAAQAQQPFDLIGQINCAQDGACTIDEIIQGFGLVINWGVSISGAIALLMFIIGGVYMLASAGRQDWVKRGKDILVGTTIALFYIFSSWLIVNFILTALVGNSLFKLEPGLQPEVTENETLQADVFCQRPNSEGVTCSHNMVCKAQKCVPKCQVVHIRGFEPEFACRPVEDCQLPPGRNCDQSSASGIASCYDNNGLCPTASDKCCYPTP